MGGTVPQTLHLSVALGCLFGLLLAKRYGKVLIQDYIVHGGGVSRTLEQCILYPQSQSGDMTSSLNSIMFRISY